MKSIALTIGLGLSCLSGALMAQTWDSSAINTGGLVYGFVSAPQNSLMFTCNTPSPQNRPLHETDDHETIRSAPFEIFVEVSSQLVASTGAADVLEAATLVVDGAGYRLPPVRWDEFISAWQVALPMDDGLFAALFDARALVFDAGRGTAWSYPVDGLSAGLGTAMQACVDGWAVAGQEIPISLSRFWREGFEGALSVQQAVAALPGRGGPAAVAPPTAPQTPTPTPALAGGLPASVNEAAALGCPNETVTVTRDQLQIADMDEDGVEDFLLNHGEVRCTQGLNYYCGAANCSIDVFLSTQGYARYDAFLGMGAELIPLEMGRTGIQIVGTFSLCGETGICPGPVVWTGSSFELNAPAAPAAPAGPKN